MITPVWQVLEPKQSSSSSSSSTCFGSPAVGYCNSNAGSGQGTSGRNGYVSMNLLLIHHTSPSSLISQLQYDTIYLIALFSAGMAGVECQKDDRAGTRIRIETVSLQKRKNEDEEQDFIKISNCILYHAAIESI